MGVGIPFVQDKPPVTAHSQLASTSPVLAFVANKAAALACLATQQWQQGPGSNRHLQLALALSLLSYPVPVRGRDRRRYGNLDVSEPFGRLQGSSMSEPFGHKDR